MKSVTTTWSATAGAHSHVAADGCPSALWSQAEVDARPVSRRGYWTSVRVVSLLAFGQSLVFLIVWLLVCASAGAATPEKTHFTPNLQLSVYRPTKQRDPFGKTGAVSLEAKALPGASVSLLLEGILYSSVDPSAIVNGRLLTLNKSVTLTSGNGEVSVKAVEITRDHAVVEVAGQRVELRLGSQADSAPK